MAHSRTSDVPDLTADLAAQIKKRHKRRKLFWLIAVVPCLLIIIAGSVYAYGIIRYNTEVAVKQNYVNSWGELYPETTVSSAVLGAAVSPGTEATPTPAIAEETDPGPASLADVDGKNDPIIKIDPIDPNIENILLIGIDGGDGLNIGHRSDTMCIVSINKTTNTVKLISVMRDIWAYFPNKNTWTKINASYAYGGPGQTVNIVNYNFGLDIQKYVVTDFEGFRGIIDTIGGIPITVTDKEATQISGLSSGGTYTLNGEQALEYARTRHIDSDFARVLRQRTVLLSIFSTLRGSTRVNQLRVANDSLAFMRSNIDSGEITGSLFSLALKVDSSIDQRTIPESGMYTIHDSGTWYMEINWDKQKASLHTFIYGT
jgi:LCP family protein required for cell wall assembly